MSILHDIGSESRWIYEAICNGLDKIPNKSMFIWDNISKQYKYSNGKYPGKEYKKKFDPKTCTNTNITRGDVIVFGGGYRNEDKLIYDGEKLEYLYTDVDDYGSVPPTYEVDDDKFDIGHFSDSIDHNEINWLSKNKLKEIKLYENKNNIYGKVIIKNKKYTICMQISQGKDFTHFNNNNKYNFNIEDGKILLINNLNKYKIYHITYLIKSDNNSEEFTKFIKSGNVSILNSESKSKYYVVKVIKERKLNEADNILEYTEESYNNYITAFSAKDLTFPCIWKTNNIYSSDTIIINKEQYDFYVNNITYIHKPITKEKIEYAIKNLNSVYIKEIIGFPISIELITKDNTMLIKELQEYINYIATHDDEKHPVIGTSYDLEMYF
jgi:hypothetical protein